MENNKRGLSAVIVTLLLVLLSLVLIGIVWVVVNNVVSGGTQQITSNSKCLNSQVEITAATCTQTVGDCNVTIKRISGTDDIDGVRLIFYNAAGDSSVNDSIGNIQTPATRRALDISTGIANITKIDVTVYFLDTAGKVSPCSSPSEFTQVQLV